jgi:hypothetical protein
MLKQINDIYIESELTISALKGFKNFLPSVDDISSPKVSINVPSVKGIGKDLLRKNTDIHTMLDGRIKNKEFIQSLVFAIATTEDYVSDVIVTIICAYPNKLLISTKGAVLADGQAYTIDIRDMLKLASLDNIIFEKATQRVRDALYASPRQYCSYLSAILGFELDENLLARFFELKASRDVFIHGGGVANDLYVSKAGALARSKAGTVLPIDGAYLRSGVACLKKIFTSTYKGLLEKYGQSDALRTVLDTQGR